MPHAHSMINVLAEDSPTFKAYSLMGIADQQHFFPDVKIKRGG